MNRADRIRSQIEAQLAPTHLEIDNESHLHAGTREETHYRCVIVSESFNAMGLLARHRHVQSLLQAERDAGMHALSLHTFTPAEWAKTGVAPASPNCAGQNH
ncbi:MAG: BolA family transcriptional regulator [Halothiobacillus sp. 20-53-49]|nr:BolA family transcriptional regulator [Halothiobacillaceae bacterium]OYV46865.1 MAG: BolA family transcriptional regulator [Halothiobacillus sp. 20-53-49]HUM99065.1 BolA family protein [Halothiobacillus sp.]